MIGARKIFLGKEAKMKRILGNTVSVIAMFAISAMFWYAALGGVMP